MTRVMKTRRWRLSPDSRRSRSQRPLPPCATFHPLRRIKHLSGATRRRSRYSGATYARCTRSSMSLAPAHDPAGRGGGAEGKQFGPCWCNNKIGACLPSPCPLLSLEFSDMPGAARECPRKAEAPLHHDPNARLPLRGHTNHLCYSTDALLRLLMVYKPSEGRTRSPYISICFRVWYASSYVLIRSKNVFEGDVVM